MTFKTYYEDDSGDREEFKKHMHPHLKPLTKEKWVFISGYGSRSDGFTIETGEGKDKNDARGNKKVLMDVKSQDPTNTQFAQAARKLQSLSGYKVDDEYGRNTLASVIKDFKDASESAELNKKKLNKARGMVTWGSGFKSVTLYDTTNTSGKSVTVSLSGSAASVKSKLKQAFKKLQITSVRDHTSGLMSAEFDYWFDIAVSDEISKK